MRILYENSHENLDPPGYDVLLLIPVNQHFRRFNKNVTAFVWMDRKDMVLLHQRNK